MTNNDHSDLTHFLEAYARLCRGFRWTLCDSRGRFPTLALPLEEDETDLRGKLTLTESLEDAHREYSREAARQKRQAEGMRRMNEVIASKIADIQRKNCDTVVFGNFSKPGEPLDGRPVVFDVDRGFVADPEAE